MNTRSSKQLSNYFLLIALISLLIFSCQKQNTLSTTSLNNKTASANSVGLPPPIIAWLKGPNVPFFDTFNEPVNGVHDAFGFGIGGKGYIGGGYVETVGSAGFQSNQLWQYDTLTHSWSQGANFPGNNARFAPSFVIGNDAYVCTGGANATKENWQYDQTANAWTRKADFPGYQRFYATATTINNKGYVGLGVETFHDPYPDTKDWWQYDPTSDSWSRKADFAGGKRDGSASFTINNKGYISCGHNFNENTKTHTYYNDLWQYNPTTDSWSQKAFLPSSDRMNAIGLSAFINKGVVMTGWGTNGALNDCWQYNASTNSWSSLPNVGGGPRYFGAGFSLGNTIYVGTGFVNTQPGETSDFWGLTVNP